MRDIRLTCPIHLQKIQLSHSECRILKLFLRMINANKVLELGTLVGCSTAWIATSLVGDNPLVVSVEKSKLHYEIARRNMLKHKLDHMVELVDDDALSFLEKYSVGDDKLFDSIFIDAKKTDYPEYLKLSKKILRSGGLIIADNTAMVKSPNKDIANALRLFEQMLAEDTDLTSGFIPTISGMTVAIKR